MKANLTRGNSVTENYYVHPFDLIAEAIAQALEIHQEMHRRARPIPKAQKGVLSNQESIRAMIERQKDAELINKFPAMRGYIL